MKKNRSTTVTHAPHEVPVVKEEEEDDPCDLLQTLPRFQDASYLKVWILEDAALFCPPAAAGSSTGGGKM